MEGSKFRSESSRVRNPYDEKKRSVRPCSEGDTAQKLLVVRILDEKTNVWEGRQALSLTAPINHFFLKHSMYIQNNALSV